MRPAGLSVDCPRCGLSIGIRSPWLTVLHCPRCVARARALVRMCSAEPPSDERYANPSISRADISNPAPFNPLPEEAAL